MVCPRKNINGSFRRCLTEHPTSSAEGFSELRTEFGIDKGFIILDICWIVNGVPLHCSIIKNSIMMRASSQGLTDNLSSCGNMTRGMCQYFLEILSAIFFSG